MDFNLLNIKIFDEDFYKKNYLKFSKHNTERDLFLHYIKFGRKQNLSINSDLLKHYYKMNNDYSQRILENYKFEENPRIIFNILIRTSNRPKFFKKCIGSILEQNYSGKVNIFVCCDTPETLEYVSKYKGINIINKEKINTHYSFNLYCNDLLDIVNTGWIIFLDDDDEFINENCLGIISSKIKKNDNLLIWQFLRPDKIISPQEKFQLGELDTTCFCFHYSFKSEARWISQRCSDFYFFKNLDDKCNFDKIFLNMPLTKTIYSDIIANYGA